jgi:hypothetical protein
VQDLVGRLLCWFWESLPGERQEEIVAYAITLVQKGREKALREGDEERLAKLDGVLAQAAAAGLPREG